jgi:hypothetical protein
MSNAPLAKARILAKEVGVDLTVCLNPKELQVEKTARWESMSEIQDEPPAQFGPTSPATMSVTLLFDTYESKKSVYREYLSHLERLIHVISDSVRRPPLSMFVWGSFCFPGVVESLSQKYTMFISDGVPVRCECALKIKKVRGALSRFETMPTAEPDRARPFNPLWSRA